MIKTIGIGLVVAILGVSASLYAEDQVDCSSVAKYDSSHQYKKGDLVTQGFGTGTGEYRCKLSDCNGTAPNEASSTTWERIGHCR